MANNQILSGKARPVPRPGEMVLDPGPRSPVQINTSKAVQTIRADERAFVSADLGRAKMGEAVGQIGDSLAKIAEQQMRDVNIRKEAEAQGMMEKADAEITAAYTNEPDETKWGAITAERIGKLKNQLAKEQYSPALKEAVDTHVSKWESQRNAEGIIASARESKRKADAIIKDRLNLAAETQDESAHERTLGDLVNTGRITPEAADLERLQFKEVGKQKDREFKAEQTNSVYALALEDPDKAEANFDGLTQGLDASQKDSLMTQIRQAKTTRSADEVNSFSDRMASGEFATLAALQAAFPEKMRPTQRKEFEGWFARMQQPGIKAKLLADAPKNFARFTDIVKNYNAKEDKDGLRYSQIIIAANQALPSKLIGSITGPLYAKRTNSGNLDAPPALKSTVDGIMDQMFKASAFGLYMKSQPPKDPKDNDDPKKWGWVEDPNLKASALAKKGEAMMHMDEWFKENPAASSDAAFAELRNFTTGKGSTPKIRVSAPIIRATPAFVPSRNQPVPDYDLDLPDMNPDTFTNPLLPAPDWKDEE